MSPTDDPLLERVIAWAQELPAVRAALLTSTRASAVAPVDAFSDYDILLAVTDVRLFFADRSWLEDFGRVLVVYRDPITPYHGSGSFAYITQYEDGLKIDFHVAPTELLTSFAADPQPDPELDVGYRVLLDKDGLTAGLPQPTYRAYIPSPPSLEEYLTLVEVFFHEATYVAKNLWRDQLLPAKFSFDHMMKQEDLRKMLEWYVEIDQGWAYRPGAYGKGLKKNLPPEIWAQLEETYTGADLEDNWEALFKTIDLFRTVAIRVGEALGYAYPAEMDRRAMAYYEKVRRLDRQATKFE